MSFQQSVIAGIDVGGMLATPAVTVGELFLTVPMRAGSSYDFGVAGFAAHVSVFDSAGFLQVVTSIPAPAGFAAVSFAADRTAVFRVEVSGLGLLDVLAAQAGPTVTVEQATAAVSGLLSIATAARPAYSAAEVALVDTAFYWANNPDVLAAGIDPVAHFAGPGWREGRAPDPLFDVSFYLAHNPDVAASGADPLAHYANFGWKEGRDPSAAFSSSGYLAHNADVRLAGLNPLAHYLEFGQYEGRAAS